MIMVNVLHCDCYDRDLVNQFLRQAIADIQKSQGLRNQQKEQDWVEFVDNYVNTEQS